MKNWKEVWQKENPFEGNIQMESTKYTCMIEGHWRKETSKQNLMNEGNKWSVQMCNYQNLYKKCEMI